MVRAAATSSRPRSVTTATVTFGQRADDIQPSLAVSFRSNLARRRLHSGPGHPIRKGRQDHCREGQEDCQDGERHAGKSKSREKEMWKRQKDGATAHGENHSGRRVSVLG